MEQGVIWLVCYIAGIIALGNVIIKSQKTNYKNKRK